MDDYPHSPRQEELADARRRGAWPPAWSEVAREGPRTITRVYSYVEPTPDSVWPSGPVKRNSPRSRSCSTSQTGSGGATSYE